LNQSTKLEFEDKIAGLLLGTAVGDALGLPFEGMSPQRIAKILGNGPLRHRFVFGRGMVSDDTEHACLTAQALLAAPNDPKRFARSLAWQLRWWLVGLPASVGLATLWAIVKLWVGFSPERSGVNSAGNGPAMRAPILGACLGQEPDKLRQYVHASTRLTHRDPRAEEGALAIAQAAWHAMRYPAEPLQKETVLITLAAEVEGTELRQALHTVKDCLAQDQSPKVFMERMNLRRGVTGYINHTVPAVLYAWLRSPTDFRKAMETVVRMGGDADTTAAIAGALAGATVGASRIPQDWLGGLIEWPRRITWVRSLSLRLASQFQVAPVDAISGPLPLFWPGILPRNLFFLAVVLAHGVRRLLPPY
jgi:ADP-ribosylglycohydrolase